MSRKKTREEVLKEFEGLWNGRYTYDNFEYVDAKTKSFITCRKHGDFPMTADDHKHGRGCPQCARELPQMGNRTKVLGIGILDIPFSKNSSRITKRAYRVWENILDRCYNDKAKKRMPTYDGCTMCEEWLMFSNFLKWFEENIKEGQHIDKDILFKGNKVYSPETCCSVPKAINSMMASCHSRGNRTLPVGVYKSGNKYVSFISFSDSTQKYLGIFATAQEAFNVFKKEKESYIKNVAQEHYNKGEITEEVYQAIMNYEIEITD